MIPHPSASTFQANEREHDKIVLKRLAECAYDYTQGQPERSFEIVIRIHDKKVMEINKRATMRLL